MRFILSIFLCVTLIFQNFSLLAQPPGLPGTQFKEHLHKIFLYSKSLDKPKEKRAYLETTLKKLLDSLKQIEAKVSTEEQKEAYEDISELYQGSLEKLETVKEDQLDEFSEFILQASTEQASIIAFVILGALGLLILFVLIPAFFNNNEENSP